MDKLLKDSKTKLKEIIDNPDAELKSKVLNEFNLDMDDDSVKSILNELYYKNIDSNGITNKIKSESKKVTFGDARVLEYYDEVYDKVYKHRFTNPVSNVGFIKLIFIMILLYASI